MIANSRVRVQRFFKDDPANSDPVIGLTCYDYSMAQILDSCNLDFLLVGDSAGNVVYGYPETNQVSLEEMIVLAAAVVRGTKRAFVVVDLPFGTYEESNELAVATAVEVIKSTGAAAVKLEGGKRMAERVEAIVQAGVPVMGHIGFTPQSVHYLGGYKVQGREAAGAAAVAEDAEAIAAAGAFAVVLEMVPAELAKTISQSLKIPTIGVGGGKGTDGQLLVTYDLMGLTKKQVKFAPRYASLDEVMSEAVTNWKQDILSGKFPGDEHSFK